MKKIIALFLCLCLTLGGMSMALADGQFAPGTYEGRSDGFEGVVKAVVTVDENAITEIVITGPDETPTIGGKAMEAMQEAYIGKTAGTDVDTVSGATYTSKGAQKAVQNALNKAAEAAAAAADAPAAADMTNAYEGSAQGFLGTVNVALTVDENGAISAIEIQGKDETPDLGGKAMETMQEAYIGKTSADDVDSVSGATYTSKAVKEAVAQALAAAQGGGAGDAQEAQYLYVLSCLVWDPADPDAATGDAYEKLLSAEGGIGELKTILNWSEAPFDEAYYQENEFVAGDIAELSQHGIHAEYLPILQALKAEIREYFVWAAPILASGKGESQLTMFCTPNLLIFQGYYGSLSQSADKAEWSWDGADQVKQLVLEGQGVKDWLEAQGVVIE